MDRTPISRALLSVSDKTDLIPFARSLTNLGIELISTGGTARALAEAGLEVTPVQDITGFPEMLDGRVKTLHPLVHGALLGRPDIEEHVDSMSEHGIVPIQLVCINLYPFEQTIRREGVSQDEAIEQIDIGGPAMIRSSAKNHEFVSIVTSPQQYDEVIDDIRRNDGTSSTQMRRKLASDAFTRTATYDIAISDWMSRKGDDPFPPVLQVTALRSRILRYGENPHQRSALYVTPGDGAVQLASAHVRSGKPLSFNNLNDAAGAVALVNDLAIVSPDRSAATVVKHTNACGASVADDPKAAFLAAWEGDPRAGFGGIVAMSDPVDAELARTISDGSRFLEVIIAPNFDDEAVGILAERWKNARLLEVPGMGSIQPQAATLRSIPGGLLVQEQDSIIADPNKWMHAAGPPADDALIEDARLMWIVCKHLSSNAIAVGGDGRLVGAGMGQVDRVGACALAIERAGDELGKLSRKVAASDAFFPFADGPELLAEAGIRCIIQPGGSKRDDETIQLCNDRDITLLMTGIRHFRH
ncbi:MAG: bifunctional phosphoribosylaminoimidazolecarboxamide formyltransferase/inosine monophosphate cyclohydrolase [Phycisphaerae bacterium]|nr:bifunctional phosphoribosylaminoimidazolecarboxamide formyltransferase/inosine monophosphate cyclohydrolase [Phycisphaerae bacterium]